MRINKEIIFILVIIFTCVRYSSARRVRDADYRLISGEEMIERGSENAVLDMFYVEHAGKFYVVKNALNNSFVYGDEEFLERELFIYMLAKRIFGKTCNLAEVQLLHYKDVQGTELGEWMRKYGFDKVLLSRLAEQYKDIEDVKNPFWREQLIAFWVFIRDFDHDLEDPDANLYLFSDREQVFGIAYDYNRALQINFLDRSSFDIGENLALSVFVKSNISYLALAQAIEQIVSIKNEGIEQLALECGINDKEEVSYLMDYLKTTRERLYRDIECLIFEVRGEVVNLSDLIRGGESE